MKLNLVKVVVDYLKARPGEKFHARPADASASIKSPRISRKKGAICELLATRV